MIAKNPPQNKHRSPLTSPLTVPIVSPFPFAACTWEYAAPVVFCQVRSGKGKGRLTRVPACEAMAYSVAKGTLWGVHHGRRLSAPET